MRSRFSSGVLESSIAMLHMFPIHCPALCPTSQTYCRFDLISSLSISGLTMSLERTALGCSGIMLPCSSASWSSGSFIGFRSAVAQFQRYSATHFSTSATL